MTLGPQSTPAEASLFGAPWKQAAAGVVLVAWFYFVGWVYSYFYFRFFHIDIFEIDMPVQYIVIETISPIRFVWLNYWPYLVGVVIILAIASIILARCNAKWIVVCRGFGVRHKELLGLFLAAIIVCTFYFGGFAISEQAAGRRAQEIWTSDAPEIQFTFSKDKKDSMVQTALSKLNDEHSLRYLLTTKDFYYVFVTATVPDPKSYMPDGLVFKIRTDAVDYASIRRRGGAIHVQ